jgi:hypothetical protein
MVHNTTAPLVVRTGWHMHLGPDLTATARHISRNCHKVAWSLQVAATGGHQEGITAGAGAA